MKSTIYIIYFIAATILLSSCGSLSISQKRYSRGLNIDLFCSKDKKPEGKKAEIATKKGAQTKETVVVENTPEIKESYSGNNESFVITEAPNIKDIKTTFSERSTIGKIKTIRKVKKILKENIAKAKVSPFLNKKDSNTKNPSESGINQLLLIICCFIPILSLLAIYWHDDGITFNFWLDLILYLTVIGWLIYALLVILDIVDLS